MSIGVIDALQIAEVQFHGIPNQERIAIYVHKFCEIGEYCMMLSMPTADGIPVPVKDHMLWFGTQNSPQLIAEMFMHRWKP
jgi:hypothetical protein